CPLGRVNSIAKIRGLWRKQPAPPFLAQLRLAAIRVPPLADVPKPFLGLPCLESLWDSTLWRRSSICARYMRLPTVFSILSISRSTLPLTNFPFPLCRPPLSFAVGA